MDVIRLGLKNKESLSKTLMHNNNVDERLKVMMNKPPSPMRIQVASPEKRKTYQFYSDTWRIFVDGEVVQRKKLNYKPMSITKYNNIRQESDGIC